MRAVALQHGIAGLCKNHESRDGSKNFSYPHNNIFLRVALPSTGQGVKGQLDPQVCCRHLQASHRSHLFAQLFAHKLGTQEKVALCIPAMMHPSCQEAPVVRY